MIYQLHPGMQNHRGRATSGNWKWRVYKMSLPFQCAMFSFYVPVLQGTRFQQCKVQPPHDMIRWPTSMEGWSDPSPSLTDNSPKSTGANPSEIAKNHPASSWDPWHWLHTKRATNVLTAVVVASGCSAHHEHHSPVKVATLQRAIPEISWVKRSPRICLILHPLLSYCWWKKSCTSWYGKISHYLQVFLDPRWCRISSINSSSDTNTLTLINSIYIIWNYFRPSSAGNP